MKKNDMDSYISVVAALLVIFTAMMSPSTSLVVSIFILIGYATYKYRQIDETAVIRPFVFSALVACIFILTFTALRDILKGAQETYYFEYAGIIFSTIIAFLLFTKSAHKTHHTNSKHKRSKTKHKRKR